MGELGTRTPPLPPSPPGGRPGVPPATSASPPPAGGTPGCQRVSPRSWSRCSRLLIGIFWTTFEFNTVIVSVVNFVFFRFLVFFVGWVSFLWWVGWFWCTAG